MPTQFYTQLLAILNWYFIYFAHYTLLQGSLQGLVNILIQKHRSSCTSIKEPFYWYIFKWQYVSCQVKLSQVVFLLLFIRVLTLPSSTIGCDFVIKLKTNILNIYYNQFSNWFLVKIVRKLNFLQIIYTNLEFRKL